MAEKKNPNLQQVINQINKKFGEGSIALATEFPRIQRISSGSLLLDMALGGGVPVGRIGELFGDEQSGKTWTSLLIATEFIKKGIKVFFIDAEGTLDVNLLGHFGFDMSMFSIVRANSGEDYCTIMLEIIAADEPSLIILDSIPALVPMSEVEKDFEQLRVAGNSGLITKLMRLIQNELNIKSKNKGEEYVDTTVILINQIRDKIGIVYGDPYQTPGGKALKHAGSWRASMRRSDWIYEDDDKKKARIGQKTTAKLVKNKTFPPFREATYSFRFPPAGALVDNVEEAIIAGSMLGILKLSGSWFSYQGEQLAQGMEKTIEVVRKNPELLNTIITEVRKMIY